jgi:hypothetical protein
MWERHEIKKINYKADDLIYEIQKDEKEDFYHLRVYDKFKDNWVNSNVRCLAPEFARTLAEDLLPTIFMNEPAMDKWEKYELIDEETKIDALKVRLVYALKYHSGLEGYSDYRCRQWDPERNIWIESITTNKAGAKGYALLKYLSMDEYRYNKFKLFDSQLSRKERKEKRKLKKKIDQKRKKEMLLEKHGEEDYKELYEKEPSELQKGIKVYFQAFIFLGIIILLAIFAGEVCGFESNRIGGETPLD